MCSRACVGCRSLHLVGLNVHGHLWVWLCRSELGGFVCVCRLCMRVDKAYIQGLAEGSSCYMLTTTPPCTQSLLYHPVTV